MSKAVFVMQFDYIISGAGAAGLSLLMRMMRQPFFDNKRILVVDASPKNTNDHTWCFWENQPGLFEPVVHHQWQQVHFYSNHYSGLINLSPYYYKMIRSIDFYNYVHAEAARHPNVSFYYSKVEATGNEGNKGLLIADGQRFTADYIFNSILFSPPPVPAGKHFLLQHFKGILIESTNSSFDPSEATLMDFRVSQQHGTTFVYVLPLTDTRALVEYTLFTEKLLAPEEYDLALRNYISTFLQLTDYTILEEEFGSIPMTNISFLKRTGRIINIGTAGGQTKASSGYTFQFIQKHSEKLVTEIVKFGYPKDEETKWEKRFKIYDSTLLNVLSNNKMPGDKIFSDLFEKNPHDRIFKFLDNETTLEDEINLMGTLSNSAFIKAAFKEIFN